MSERIPPNLALAGFMGTGKSTVGALLARRMNWRFVDTDALVERQAGISISEIFATQGEAAFRLLERRACLYAARQSCVVISTGGGALLDMESRVALEGSAVIVLLSCESDLLAARLQGSALRGERPMLAERFTQRIDELLKAREPLYSSIPLQVDTTRLAPEGVADLVLNLYMQASQDRRQACTI
ncbi:MAG: shikimate kinase [Chloroflexi bacterium]|nr:shikimate kinase [Chloroflexota bacterium]